MNADEALRLFAEAVELPRDALRWALDNWDDASPRFISKLRAYAANPTESQIDPTALFCIVLLCGEKCDSRAYVPLCGLIATDDSIRDWLGDGVTASLSGILINVYDGDVEPLKRAIEAPDADEFARAAAIDALAYLVRAKGAMTDDEMGDYLSDLANVMRPRAKSTVWSAWVCAVGQLGYIQLRGLVTRMFSKGWIDTFETGREDFYHDLRLARGQPDGMAAFAAAGVGPFGSAIEALEDLESDEESDLENPDDVEDDLDYSDEDDPPYLDDLSDSHLAEKPYVNPLREVGRNDPCPCGSGKKYKKCCLAA